MDTFTKNLNIRLPEIGSEFPHEIANKWGAVLNNELEKIDAAIGEVCTPEQIERIKALLPMDRKGMVL